MISKRHYFKFWAPWQEFISGLLPNTLPNPGSYQSLTKTPIKAEVAKAYLAKSESNPKCLMFTWPQVDTFA